MNTAQAARKLFEQVVDLPAEKQAEVLGRYQAHPELVKQVRALLDVDTRLEHEKPTNAAEPRTRAHRWPGETIGAYRLIAPIGAGGMGSVWRASTADGSAHVAVKFAQRFVGSDATTAVARSGASGGGSSPVIGLAEREGRLQQEARILGSIRHPGVVGLIDAGQTASGEGYLIMPELTGKPAVAYAKAERPTAARLIEVCRLICGAVQAVHAIGVIHRDLKPQNVLITPDGWPTLIDFGAARVTPQAGFPSIYETQGHAPITPAYASPEQAAGVDADHASDIYALGVLFRQMLAYVVDPTSASARTLTQAIAIATEQRPADRYPSTALFAAALETMPPRPRGGLLVVSTALFAGLNLGLLAGLGVSHLLDEDPAEAITEATTASAASNPTTTQPSNDAATPDDIVASMRPPETQQVLEDELSQRVDQPDQTAVAPEKIASAPRDTATENPASLTAFDEPITTKPERNGPARSEPDEASLDVLATLEAIPVGEVPGDTELLVRLAHRHQSGHLTTAAALRRLQDEGPASDDAWRALMNPVIHKPETPTETKLTVAEIQTAYGRASQAISTLNQLPTQGLPASKKLRVAWLTQLNLWRSGHGVAPSVWRQLEDDAQRFGLEPLPQRIRWHRESLSNPDEHFHEMEDDPYLFLGEETHATAALFLAIQNTFDALEKIPDINEDDAEHLTALFSSAEAGLTEALQNDPSLNERASTLRALVAVRNARIAWLLHTDVEAAFRAAQSAQTLMPIDDMPIDARIRLMIMLARCLETMKQTPSAAQVWQQCAELSSSHFGADQPLVQRFTQRAGRPHGGAPFAWPGSENASGSRLSRRETQDAFVTLLEALEHFEHPDDDAADDEDE